MEFCHFWSFFVIWGYILNPQAPSSSSHPLTLTPTLPVINWRKIWTTWKFSFHFLSSFLVYGHMATPSPIWPSVTPWGAPLWPPPAHISFSTSIQCLCSELYLLMHGKIEFTAQCHTTFSRSQNVGFLPFWAIFANFAEFLYWFGSSHKLSEAGSRLTPPHTITKLYPLTTGTHGGNVEHLYLQNRDKYFNPFHQNHNSVNFHPFSHWPWVTPSPLRHQGVSPRYRASSTANLGQIRQEKQSKIVHLCLWIRENPAFFITTISEVKDTLSATKRSTTAMTKWFLNMSIGQVWPL